MNTNWMIALQICSRPLDNTSAVDYLQARTLPKIISNCRLKWTEPWIGQHQWNNNSCESANHLLKLEIDWKPQRVTDLIDHLHTVVRQQYVELRGSLFGRGDFQLAPQFVPHHLITQIRWNSMTNDAKDRAFKKFMVDDGKRHDKKTVTSTDGNLTVIGSPRIARKTGQRRRPKADRTAMKKM